jgi:hypothetical protein
MHTVKSLMNQFTSPEVVLQNVSNTLRQIAPDFVKEERQYYESIGVLKDTLGASMKPSVDEYIAAIEEEISAELVYVAWLGFQQNIECFNNPINTMFLKMDYEDFHRERRMATLPQVQHALKTINAFHDVLRTRSGFNHELTEGITSYITYLETVGYKLAHYFGFIFADKFLEHVIPGYRSDMVTTMQYERELEDYLGLDLRKLN